MNLPAEPTSNPGNGERHMPPVNTDPSPGFPPPVETRNGTTDSSVYLHGSTLGNLLQLAGTWEGDDIRECLKLVHESRMPLEF